MKELGVFFVCLTSLTLTSLIAAATPEDSLPYCSIDRHNVTLALLFKFEEKGCNVMVQRHDFDDIRPDSPEVLFCELEKDKGTYSCKAGDGYIVIAQEDSSVTVGLVNASSRHDGTYECQLSNCNHNTKIIRFNFNHSETRPYISESDLKTDIASTGGNNQGETVWTNTSEDGVKAEGMKAWTIAVIVITIALPVGIAIAVTVLIRKKRKKARTPASNNSDGNNDGDDVNENLLQQLKSLQHDNFDRPPDPSSQQNHLEGTGDPCREQNMLAKQENPSSRQNKVERLVEPQQTKVDKPEDISPQKVDVQGPVDSHSQKNNVDGPGGCPQQEGNEGPGGPSQQNIVDGPADPCPHENNDEEPEDPCLQQNDNVQKPGDPIPQTFGEPDKFAAASKPEVDNTEAANSYTRSSTPHEESKDGNVTVEVGIKLFGS